MHIYYIYMQKCVSQDILHCTGPRQTCEVYAAFSPPFCDSCLSRSSPKVFAHLPTMVYYRLGLFSDRHFRPLCTMCVCVSVCWEGGGPHT